MFDCVGFFVGEGQQIPSWRSALRRNDTGFGWVERRGFDGCGRRRVWRWGGFRLASLWRDGRGAHRYMVSCGLSVRRDGLECGLEILRLGWILIDGEGDFDEYVCAGGIGVDFHGALKLADAFAPAADAADAS